MKQYIMDREMMLLALQWMPKELRDEWAADCIEVPEDAKLFTKQKIEDGLYRHTTMHRRCCRDSAESLFVDES